jgi:hypothetical protein
VRGMNCMSADWGKRRNRLWVGSTPSAAMSVVGSAGIILTSYVGLAWWQAKLRTTYTYSRRSQTG